MNSVLSSVRGAWNGIPQFLQGMIVGAALVLVAMLYTNHLQAKHFEREVEVANRVADSWEIAYHQSGDYWEERARQLIDGSEALGDSLSARNAALARDLRDAESRVQMLQEANVELVARLDSSASEVEQEDSTTFRVDLDERVAFDGGGFVHVRGPVRIEVSGPTVATDLSVSGEFPLSVVISRTSDGELRVDAFTGDPRLAVSRLDVTANVERPASPATGIAEALTGADAWFNRALGAAACVAVGSLLR